MITSQQLKVKRVFDVFFGILLIPFLILPMLIMILVAAIETRQSGIFTQKRIGQHGQPFSIYKIRTLRDEAHHLGELEKSATRFGLFFRKTKLDELPQLFNVIKGDMSVVGPRPDVLGFADTLTGEDRLVLKVKPGITGPATLAYKNEELVLFRQKDPVTYNREVIWKDKVEINKDYVKNWSFSLDLKIIIKSLRS